MAPTPANTTRLTWLCTSLLLAMTGCGSRFWVNGNMVTPVAGTKWLEVNTEHVRMYTDLDQPAAEEAALALERIHRTLWDLSDFLFPNKPKPPAVTKVVQLRNAEEYQTLTDDTRHDGVFARHGLNGVPTMLAAGEATMESERLFRHELAHQFIAYHAPGAPPWLHEGLAQYFEALRVSDGQALFGEQPASVAIYQVGAARGLRAYELPTVRELLSTRHQRFHEETQPNQMAEHSEPGYYRGSWGLVHLLNNGSPEYRERFLAFLKALSERISTAEAWQTAFASLPFETLERDYRAHFFRIETLLYRTEYQEPKLDPPTTRALSEPEVIDVMSSARRLFRQPPKRTPAG